MDPPIPIKDAITKRYTITINLTPSILVFKSLEIVTNDTLTILPSIADMKVPIAVIGNIFFKGKIFCDVSEEMDSFV